MNLHVAGVSLKLRELRLRRSLGAPVEWQFGAVTTRESRGGRDVGVLLRALGQGQQTATANDAEGGLTWSGPPATVVGAAWGEGNDADRLTVVGLSTYVKGPDPFVPRRRVLRALNLRALLEKNFDHVCQAVPKVLEELGRVKLPPAQRPNIIQDGISDWEFVGRLLGQYSLLRPQEERLPLTLTGSTADGTSGRWLVVGGGTRAYAQWKTIKQRTPKLSPSGSQDGLERFEFGSAHSVARVPQFPHQRAPSAIVWRQGREFSSSRWKDWSTRDVPRFTTDGAMIWKIEDRLYHSGAQKKILWDSRLWTLPPEATIMSPIVCQGLMPWVGAGKVKDRSANGTWIDVELEGFEKAKDANLAQVLLTTSYSGHGGSRGVNLVPEKDTDVLVTWSGRFDSSLLFAGNTRPTTSDSEFAAPSIYLENLYTAQYADVNVKDVGQVLVESALKLGVRQETKMSISKRLQMTADGADLRMENGTVYTGRG